MELNKEVPKREYCEKLRELGYPQEGLFWHCFYEPEDEWIILDNTYFQLEKWGAGKPQDTGIIGDYCVAPTVAEMGEILPMDYLTAKDGLSNWCYGTLDQLKNPDELYTMSRTEADARAKMLIYLLENKLISLEKE